MRTKMAPASWILVLASAASAWAGPFQNLDFESAVISPVGQSATLPSAIYAASALPGWTVLKGSDTQTQVVYNGNSLGGTQIGLSGPNVSGLLPNNGYILDGTYSVLLNGGAEPDANAVPVFASASILQTGAIPSGARSLRFEAATFSSFAVTINGQAMPLTILAIQPRVTFSGNVILYGSDVSGFAAQTVALEFTSIPVSGHLPSLFAIDDIVFSPTPIPEPGSLALTALGSIVLGSRRLGRRK